jgi:signal transduction histidine kinase
MRVGTKLSAGFLVLIVLFGGLLLFYHRVLQRSVDAGQALASVDSRVLLGASSLLDLFDRMEEDASKFRITRDDGYLQAYRSWRVAARDTLLALEALELDRDQRDALAETVRTWDSFAAEFVDTKSPAEEARFLAGSSEADLVAFLAPLESLRLRTRAVRLASNTGVTDKIRAMSREADRAARTGWLAIATALILAGGIAISIVRSITAPLRQIEAGAGAIARGEFDARVEVRGGGELASLATSFNEMAERVGELDQAKRDFLARVSHDLKTPLASVRETGRVLLDRIPGELNEKQARLLELALRNADRLATMISRLLELSRLEAGVEDYQPERVDLVGLTTDTVERLSPGWSADNGTGARVTQAVSRVPVLADRAALERVLENLLDNARGHAGGGEIEVEVDLEPVEGGVPRAVVRVRDHGPGIPPDERVRIFDSFARRNGDYASGHVGLGLAICREIVAAHGGETWVSDADGGGSVFAFSLPADQGGT